MQVAQDHAMAVTVGILVTITLIAAWWMLGGKRWYRKVRRRRGGVYLWRTRRHHLRPRWLSWLGMRENGYVGESVNFYLRAQDHMGKGRYGQTAQPWSDLDPVMYRIFRLPWWLCWKWVLRPLETLVIWVTMPRYNDSKNRWNPRRITKSRARAQRMERDRVRITWGSRAGSWR